MAEDCDLLVVQVDPDGSMVRAESVWLYWVEGTTERVMRIDADGTVRSLRAGGDASVATDYAEPFTTRTDTQVKTCITNGPKPALLSEMRPHLTDRVVKLGIGAEFNPRRPKVAPGGAVNSLRLVALGRLDVPAAQTPTIEMLAPTASQQFVIDVTPQMPEIEVQMAIRGTTIDPTATTHFEWTAEMQFNPQTAGCAHGPNRTFAQSMTGAADGGSFRFRFLQIMGGDLVVKLKATVQGHLLEVESTGLTVAATNPTRAAIQGAIADEILQRIANHESGQRQLDAAPGAVTRCALWSGDNLGGVGIFQITVPRPSDAQVWNWRENVEAGRRRLQQGRTQATNYRGQIAGSNTFRNMVAQINADRAVAGRRPITAQIPPYTAAQVEDDAIRAFNGYGGNRDQFGFPLHEFRLAMDGALVRLTIDEVALLGTAQWERVPVADRGASGDPNYVNHVHAANPNPT